MYSDRQQLPVRTGVEVVSLSGERGEFRLLLADGEVLAADQVVVATGAFGVPFVPSFAAGLSSSVVQVHSDQYRNPAQLPTGTVLVVGGGNSGFQIALELVETGRAVALSEGTRLRAVPQRILGRDIFWWLTATRLIYAPTSSRVGRRLRANEPVIGLTRRALRLAGVNFRGRSSAANGTQITFVDGSPIEVDAVVWATGYRQDDRWVTIPGALDADGALVTDRGVTPVAGLYTIGRPWQKDRGSALLGFVHRDAKELSRVIGSS